MSEATPNFHTDLIWKTRMKTLMKMTKNMEVKQIIDETIYRYYSEKGQDVPRWRVTKDPQWWIDYLNELGIEQ